jgi:hypothetical protein
MDAKGHRGVLKYLGGMDMGKRILSALSATCLLALAGCNKAESPATVQNDVSKAADSAADKNAKAAQKQAETEASASKDVGSAEMKADSQAAAASADTAVTEAEGTNKISLAKCEALSGELQQACKDKAKAALDMAKAKAKELKAEHP